MNDDDDDKIAQFFGTVRLMTDDELKCLPVNRVMENLCYGTISDETIKAEVTKIKNWSDTSNIEEEAQQFVVNEGTLSNGSTIFVFKNTSDARSFFNDSELGFFKKSRPPRLNRYGIKNGELSTEEKKNLERLLKMVKDVNMTQHFQPDEVPRQVVTINKACFWNVKSKHLQEAVYVPEEKIYILLPKLVISEIANLVETQNLFYVHTSTGGNVQVYSTKFQIDDVYARAIYSHHYCCELTRSFSCRNTEAVIFEMDDDYEFSFINDYFYSHCASANSCAVKVDMTIYNEKAFASRPKLPHNGHNADGGLAMKKNNDKPVEPDIQEDYLECVYKCMFKTRSLFEFHLHLYDEHHAKDDFSCKICGATFARNYGLKAHEISKHSNKKLYECQTCKSKFARKDVLDRHVKVHNERQYTCSVCQQYFSRKEGCDAHVKNAHTSALFRCDLCTCTFSNREFLAQHKKYQHPEAFFDGFCSYCGQGLLRQYLKAHEDGHEGGATHECGECRAKFNSASKAKNHRYMHKGPKAKYYCEICKVTFSNKKDYDVCYNKHEEEWWGIEDEEKQSDDFGAGPSGVGSFGAGPSGVGSSDDGNKSGNPKPSTQLDIETISLSSDDE